MTGFEELLLDLQRIPLTGSGGDILGRLVARIAEAGFDRVLLRFGGAADELRENAASSGFDGDRNALSIALTLVAAAERSGRVVPGDEQPGERSTLALPLIVGGQTRGALLLARRAPASCAQEFLSQAQLLAAQAGLVLALHHASTGLAQCELFYKTIFENSADAIFLAYPDGRIQSANPAACRMLGREAHDIPMLRREDVVLTDDGLRAAVDERQRSGRFVGELTFKRADGTLLPVELSSSVFETDGIPRSCIIARDITDRIAARRALEEQERVLSSFFDSSPFMMGLVDLEGDDLRHVADNAAARAALGLTKEALAGRLASTRGVSPGQLSVWVRHCRESRDEGRPIQFDYELPTSTTSRWLSVTVHHVGRGATGLDRFSYVIEDVSYRKEGEARAVRLAAMYRALSRTAEAVAHCQDRDSLLQDVCEIATRYTGFGMAVVALADPQTGRIDPLAYSGSAAIYLDVLRLHAAHPIHREACPKQAAVAAGRHYVCNDWQAETTAHDCPEAKYLEAFRSSTVFPLIIGQQVVGTFTIYSEAPHAFDEEFIDVLKEMASALSFGLETLERDRQRREAEDRLRQSEAHLRRLLETALEGVWIADAEANTLYVNPRMAQLLGCAPEEMLGRNVFEFMTDDSAPVARSRGGYLGGESGSFDCCFRRRDGSELWAIVNTSPVLGADSSVVGTLAMITDITDRKRGDAAVRDSQALLSRVMHLAPMIVYLYDVTTRRMVYINQAVEATLGYTPEEVGAMDWETLAQVVHPDDHATVLAALKNSSEEGDVIEYQCRLRDRQGEWRSMSHRQVVFSRDAAALPQQVLGVAKDITNRIREQERERQRSADMARIGRLVSMGEMASALAHEINQPLAAIANFSQACLNYLDAGEADSDDLRRLLQKTVAQAERAGAVVHRIRDFIKRREPKPESLDINAVVQGAVHLAQSRWESSHAEFRLTLDTGLPPVWADRILLEQALLNLIKNAEEAAHGSHAIVELTTRPGEPGCVVVSVADHGRGLPPGFDFARLRSFFSTKPDGMGLGLTITRGIVEASGGRIWVTANGDRGALFSFSLPVAT